MAGWTSLTNQPTFNANHMMLLTDGTVLVQELATTSWYRFVPDRFGSYVNGTWSSVESSPWAPTYFASAVLSDGRVFVAGGEDNFDQNEVDSNVCAIYDPFANHWQTIEGPGWANIGDAPCVVLPDGKVLLGDINSLLTVIYDPATGGWGGGGTKEDQSAEETWTLLPDQTVLVADCASHPAAEKYVAAAREWVSAGSTPDGHDLVQTSGGSEFEIGPAILRPDGTVFAIGATGHTALYTMSAMADQPGAWTPGPDFPADSQGNLYQAYDAPAVLLTNGNVLCVAGPAQPNGWAGNPSYWYEFDGTSLNPAPSPPTAQTFTYEARMLLLPTGEVLLSTDGPNIQVYTSDGAPDPSWAPQITECPSIVRPGGTYTIKGKQLNGLSQANSYGDDGQMATNFPLVRVTNNATGHVVYCPTKDFSTMGVATGSVVHSATFYVPPGTDTGPSVLCVVANGIASCTRVVVEGTAKRWKELKHEIKENIKLEIKENIKPERDVVQKGLIPDIPKLKDAEGDPWQSAEGDPAWLAAVRLIAEQVDALHQEVADVRAFIRPEERPSVGEAALRDPKAPATSGPEQPVRPRPRKGRP